MRYYYGPEAVLGECCVTMLSLPFLFIIKAIEEYRKTDGEKMMELAQERARARIRAENNQRMAQYIDEELKAMSD